MNIIGSNFVENGMNGILTKCVFGSVLLHVRTTLCSIRVVMYQCWFPNKSLFGTTFRKLHFTIKFRV